MSNQRISDDSGTQGLSRRRVVPAAAVVLAAVLAGAGAWSLRRAPDAPLADAEAQLVAWPEKDRWPEPFSVAPANTQDLYRYAAANQDVLKWLPCFCGCVEQGHTSNFDCFVKQVRGDGSIVLETMSFG